MSELRHIASSVPDIKAAGRSANGVSVSDGSVVVAAPDLGGRWLGRGPAA